MTVFSKKGILPLAVMFLAGVMFTSVMFTGCGKDEDPPVDKYTVTFDTRGAGHIAPVTVNDGESITLPTPEGVGTDVDPDWKFSGWYSAASGGSRYGSGGSKYKVTKDVTMYAQWSDITDLLSADYIDASFAFTEMDGSMACGSWYYHSGDGAEITEAEIKIGEVSWKATLPPSSPPSNFWPYASMNIHIDDEDPFLPENFEIHLTYTSDRNIQIILSDDSPAANNGAGYAALLRSGTDVSRTLTKADFEQPEWALDPEEEEDYAYYPLDVKRVVGFSFDMGENYNRTVNVKITKLEGVGFWND